MPIGKLLNCPSSGDCPTSHLVYTNGGFEQAFLAEDNNVAEVYSIKTKIGTEIKATYNHSIGIVGEEGKFSWKKAEDVKKGDWVIHVLGGHIAEDADLPVMELNQHFNAKHVELPKKMSHR